MEPPPIRRENSMMKIMTFNIRYGSANDGENQWEYRKELVVARIQAFQPDLLGMQECQDNVQGDFVKENLPDHQFYGVRREGGDTTSIEMAPLFFRPSAFTLIQKGYFWLSETPHVPGSKSWGTAFARTVTWVELKHPSSELSFLFVNTHFDYQYPAIDESARCLKHWLNKVACIHPIILTGDFNSDKNSFAYQHLTSGDNQNGIQLFDAYRQANPNPTNEHTFHGFNQPGTFSPIDWILVSHHFQVKKAIIDTFHRGKLYPSDHYPLTAVLDWKK